MERRGGCLTACAVVLSLCVVALGAFLVFLVSQETSADTPTQEPEARVVKSFDAYTYPELSQIASLIAAAESEEEGRAVAEEWNLHVGDERFVQLDDGRQATLTVVGIRADMRSDGSGPAGLTLMLTTLSLRPMNDLDSNVGGWASSALRGWLAQDGLDLLPDDLASAIVSVTKRTNNVGVTSDVASVGETTDALWLFSLSEVCGQVTLFADEYGDEIRGRTYYVDYTLYDAVLSQEGGQYEYFSSAGISCSSVGSGVLARAYDGRACSWWYRTAYPYSFTGEDAYFFYQVMDSGYPSTIGYASQEAGVVVGLCL